MTRHIDMVETSIHSTLLPLSVYMCVLCSQDSNLIAVQFECSRTPRIPDKASCQGSQTPVPACPCNFFNLRDCDDSIKYFQD